MLLIDIGWLDSLAAQGNFTLNLRPVVSKTIWVGASELGAPWFLHARFENVVFCMTLTVA